MKPEVERTKRAEVVILRLPTPKGIKEVKDSKLVKEWQSTYLPLTNESMALMFADECGAIVVEVELEEANCCLVLKFNYAIQAERFVYLMGRF